MARAPTSMMRRAARGELSLPAEEAIEILVALAGDRELGAEAEQTLASWDEASLVEVASDAGTPPEVLRYLLQNQAQRPAVVAALCGNPALALEELEAAASHGGAGDAAGNVAERAGAQLEPSAGTDDGRIRRRSRLGRNWREWLASARARRRKRPRRTSWTRHAESWRGRTPAIRTGGGR